MPDLTPRWIIIKATLFLFTGFLAAGYLLWSNPTLQFAFFLIVAIWSFCRFYYFAFYVIQHYIDLTYRFDGLWSAVLYGWKHRRHTPR
ncbi:hypothetical protein [Lacunimicrobium album]